MIFAFLPLTQSRSSELLTRLQLTQNVESVEKYTAMLKVYRLPIPVNIDTGSHDTLSTYTAHHANNASPKMAIITRSTVTNAVAVMYVDKSFEETMLIKWRKGSTARLQCRLDGHSLAIIGAENDGNFAVQVVNVTGNSVFCGQLFKVSVMNGDEQTELDWLEDNLLSAAKEMDNIQHLSQTGKGHLKLQKELALLSDDCDEMAREAVLVSYLMRHCNVI